MKHRQAIHGIGRPKIASKLTDQDRVVLANSKDNSNLRLSRSLAPLGLERWVVEARTVNTVEIMMGAGARMKGNGEAGVENEIRIQIGTDGT